MIATINRNWNEIKRVMILSQNTTYNWRKYSQIVSNGLSNNVLTKKGCGKIIYFVEHLPEYAKTSNEYLKFTGMEREYIDFIDKNRSFLITIN